ncbi:hypothetical protein VTJ49DRAFT_2538 [Mycothermus thermophilus]|uniref:BTB domain-containing protein n=1 Tax=Humicola insolens TaxID=85995 RepID=A0ABR3VA86_HUMIN
MDGKRNSLDNPRSSTRNKRPRLSAEMTELNNVQSSQPEGHLGNTSTTSKEQDTSSNSVPRMTATIDLVTLTAEHDFDAANVMDRHGDLTLIVKPHGTAFKVCSRALARASPVWDELLYGRHSENNSDPRSDDSVSSSRAKSLEALRIILRSVHSNLTSIPPDLDAETLVDLAVMCDEYKILRLFERNWPEWTMKAKELARGDELKIAITLRIFWILGCEAEFAEAFRLLVFQAHHAKEFNSWLDYADVMEENEHIRAMGFAKHLASAREVLIACLWSTSEEAVETLSRADSENCQDNGVSGTARACDCAMLGALQRTPRSRGWRNLRDFRWLYTNTRNVSVSGLLAELEELRRETIIESGMAESHKNCGPWDAQRFTNVEQDAHQISKTGDNVGRYIEKS